MLLKGNEGGPPVSAPSAAPVLFPKIYFQAELVYFQADPVYFQAE